MSAALAWLGDYGRVRRWMARHDARRALAAGGGIAWFPDFLPGPVAHAALSILESVPDSQWNATVAYEDRTSNDIAHQFWSLKAGGARSPLAALLRVFPVLLPDEPYSTFSAARYDCSHHIDPHDDRAYTQVQRDDGRVVECSRHVALVFYLTRDWTAEHGGQFVDLAGGGRREYVPAFNCAVAFEIPRWHAVAPVAGPRPRYSVFGWFLRPGRAYELETGPGESPGWDAEDDALRPAQCKLGRRLLRLGDFAGEDAGHIDDRTA